MKFCPKCGSAIMPGSNNCPNCGELFNNSVSIPVQEPQAINSNNMVAPLPVEVPLAPLPVAAPPVVEQPIPVMSAPIIENQVIEQPVNVEPPMAPVEVSPVIAQPVVDEAPIEQPVMAQTVPVEVHFEPAPANVVEQQVVSTEPVIVPEPVAQAPEAVVPPMAPIIEPKVETSVPVEEKKTLTPEEKEKKFNKIITIFIITIAVLALAVTAFFLIRVFGKQEESSNTKVILTTQYTYEGFDFFLPEGVVASVENDEFIIRDTEETWSAAITIQDGTYNTLVSNKAQISSYFENYGYVATEAEEKEVSGTSFVTSEVLMGSKNVLVAYAKASGTKIYGIIYVNELGTYDSYSLKVVGEILASAINRGYDNAMPEGFTIDMFKETFEVAK